MRPLHSPFPAPPGILNPPTAPAPAPATPPPVEREEHPLGGKAQPREPEAHPREGKEPLCPGRREGKRPRDKITAVRAPAAASRAKVPTVAAPPTPASAHAAPARHWTPGTVSTIRALEMVASLSRNPPATPASARRSEQKLLMIGGNPCHSESRSAAETASRRLPEGRAKRGNFVESHGGLTKREIRSAKSERRLPGPFVIRHSTFPHAPPRPASPS